MRLIILFNVFCFFSCTATPNTDFLPPSNLQILDAPVNEHVQVTIDLLEGMKAGSDVSTILEKIASFDQDELIKSLNTKNKKLAFWINIYNGFIQYELVGNPSIFADKGSFYKDQRHKVAGIMMSYDNFEHGILRNSRIKLSLGYLKRWFVPSWEKKMRIKDVDGRIHFTLNCGAKDCPPIGIFSDVNLDQQLDKVTKSYLMNSTKVDGNKITTSPLFSWFRADFGGKKGATKFLQHYKVIPEGKFDLSFKSYDWTLLTGNYIDL